METEDIHIIKEKESVWHMYHRVQTLRGLGAVVQSGFTKLYYYLYTGTYSSNNYVVQQWDKLESLLRASGRREIYESFQGYSRNMVVQHGGDVEEDKLILS